MSVELSRKLLGYTNDKTLVDTADPDFMMTEWELRSNGAHVSVVYTYIPEKGPAATPVVWMPSFEDSKESQVQRAIERIKRNNVYGGN